MINEIKTTFWNDFSIADKFGIDAIKDTAKRAFEEWKDNVEYITEFIIVLNWKIWSHWENGNLEVSKVYDELWREYHQWAIKHLKGKDLEYYIQTTD